MIIVKIELNNFIIETDKYINYIEDIIFVLENKTCNILDFFELDKLSKKKKVIIFTDREKYKKHLKINLYVDCCIIMLNKIYSAG